MTLNLNLAGHADESGPETLPNGRFRVRTHSLNIIAAGDGSDLVDPPKTDLHSVQGHECQRGAAGHFGADRGGRPRRPPPLPPVSKHTVFRAGRQRC